MGKIDYDVGDLVVCVDDGPCGATGKTPTVSKGCCYTVTRIEIHPLMDNIACWLAEAAPYGHGFRANRFRKLPKKSQEFFAGAERMVDA